MHKLALGVSALLVAMTVGASAYEGHRHGGGFGGYGAHSRQSEIDLRQSRQHRAIQDGLRRGDLTRREFHHLQNEQARINDLERRALRDGRVDRHEAAVIRQAQREAGRHIYQERNDSERRGSWARRRWW